MIINRSDAGLYTGSMYWLQPSSIHHQPSTVHPPLESFVHAAGSTAFDTFLLEANIATLHSRLPKEQWHSQSKLCPQFVQVISIMDKLEEKGMLKWFKQENL
jgi:hypothetical protein